MLVRVAPERAYDDALGYMKNALTLATKDVRPFGMAPYNFTKLYEDFLDGNQPSVITREYVELPLIGNAADAANVKWGAVYNEAGTELQPNDFVTWSRDDNNKGKIVKWVKGTHAPEDIVGQVGEIETDQEPFGWLKWAMWDEAARREDQDGPVNKSGYDAPGDGGYPYDPEFKRLGKDGEGGYLSQYTTLNDATGVPGILDGKQKAETVHTRKFTIPAGIDCSTPVAFAMGYKNIIDQTVTVLIDNGEVTDYNMNYGDGTLTFVPTVAQAGKELTVRFRAEFFGTPAGWDHKGATGAARILLKF